MLKKEYSLTPREAVDAPGSVQGWIGRRSEQTGLVEGVPTHGPFQPNPFYASVIP